MWKAAIFTGVIALLLFGCRQETWQSRACRWLWAQQQPDGSWRSETQGLLKTGQVLTPFILWQLLHADLPDYKPDPEKVEKGIQYIRNHVSDIGSLGHDDPLVLEYPNYATAYALRVLLHYGSAADSGYIRAMAGYLIRQQFDEDRGIAPGHPAYGGWGFGENLPMGQTGHVDLSHTRKILQALRDANIRDASVFVKAQRFLAHMQNFQPLSIEGTQSPNPNAQSLKNTDGGFYYAPEIPAANKGGGENGAYRSYATASADGLLALLAAGYGAESPPVKAALQWLQAHPSWSHPEGIDPTSSMEWDKVMHFYHIAVRSEALRAMRVLEAEIPARDAILQQEQDEEGWFANPYGTPNKEDDPLVATALALSI